jgi:hypothetical protein
MGRFGATFFGAIFWSAVKNSVTPGSPPTERSENPLLKWKIFER